jgi:hypothetical protein
MELSNRLKKILDKSKDFREKKFQIINDQSISEKTQSEF